MAIGDKKVVIIDYDLGNLYSVIQACKEAGMNPLVSSKKEDFDDADALILPGVGAFGEAMDHLRNLGLDQAIKDFAASGKPLLGVCLGMQLLFSKSEEFGEHEGLGIIEGVIKRFPSEYEGNTLRVPQIAWNKITAGNSDAWSNSPCSSVEEGAYMYFIHSFYAQPEDESNVCSKTNYEGLEYCSSVLKGNVFATQFHPEKSAHDGLSIYRTWAEMYLS